jgi:hypothetical protein
VTDNAAAQTELAAALAAVSELEQNDPPGAELQLPSGAGEAQAKAAKAQLAARYKVVAKARARRIVTP